MRLAALMGCRVFDADGVEIGGVHDVRFVADGAPYAPGGRPAYRLAALVVGSAGIGGRLGYVRDEMRGPWPLAAVFRRLARSSYEVTWDEVDRVERPKIFLRVPRAALRSAAEGAGRSTR
jgi:hypothetical protein